MSSSSSSSDYPEQVKGADDTRAKALHTLKSEMAKADAFQAEGHRVAQEAAQLAHNVELNRQCVEQTWRRLERRSRADFRDGGRRLEQGAAHGPLTITPGTSAHYSPSSSGEVSSADLLQGPAGLGGRGPRRT